MDSKFIADRITELRLKKNVSEYQMSLDLGRNKTYIQSITSGRNLPKMNHFLDICDYLGVTPMEFFDDELHHIPLQQKANELLKQLDEEDLLAVIYSGSVVKTKIQDFYNELIRWISYRDEV